MLNRILSGDYPRSRVLTVVLLAIFLGLAFAPFLFPGVKALSVAAKVLIFIVLVASFTVAEKLLYVGLATMVAVSVWDFVSPANRRCGPDGCAVPPKHA
mgnify:CR=1 FL=1